MPRTPCICPLAGYAGYCPRHQVEESGSHQQRLCATKPAYFRLYDQRAAARGVVLNDIQSVTDAPAPRITKKPEKPGLGDVVHAALAMVGITPERVEAFLGRPCGCGERQRKWNLIGWWAAGVFAGLTGAADLEKLTAPPKPEKPAKVKKSKR